MGELDNYYNYNNLKPPANLKGTKGIYCRTVLEIYYYEPSTGRFYDGITKKQRGCVIEAQLC